MAVDKETVEKARRGDSEAWAIVCEDTHPTIVRFVQKKLASNPEIVDDVVSQTFLKGKLALHKTDHTKPLNIVSWLQRIATNLMQDEWRARKNKPQTSLDLLVENRKEPTVEADPAALYEEREWHELLGEVEREVMGLLHPDQARVLDLRKDGLSNAEIAERMGREPRQIKGVLERARKSARQWILTVAAEKGLDLAGRL